MYRKTIALIGVLVLLVIGPAQAQAVDVETLEVKPVGGAITIDGSGSDWDLGAFSSMSRAGSRWRTNSAMAPTHSSPTNPPSTRKSRHATNCAPMQSRMWPGTTPLDAITERAQGYVVSTLLDQASLNLTRGQINEAMGKVNNILATDPSNRQAQAMRARIEIAANEAAGFGRRR